MLSVTMLPARQGDAIWVRWGDAAAPHQMLVDMGTEEVGRAVSTRILAMPEAQREFDLLVVTHADADHIGGVLTCLADEDAAPIPGLVLHDVWFNGWVQLNGGAAASGLESMGPAEGERLSTWLGGQRWNGAFGGGPVMRTPGLAPRPVSLFDGLTLTVLGPTPGRLSELVPVWREAVAEALRKGKLVTVAAGLESLGRRTPPTLENADDLRALAETPTDADDSETNGSSIVLLLEYRDRRLLLAGDAFAPDIVAGIDAVSPGAQLHLDAFKAPHHGSQNNVSAALVGAVDCERWLISTDGTQFRHPDAIALARIVLGNSRRPAVLAFNVPSTFNGWWTTNADWRRLFDYETCSGTEDDGLTIDLD